MAFTVFAQRALVAALFVMTAACASAPSDAPETTATRSVSKDEAPVIGVNSFLWRASLETINFMPLESADPYGGVIITDWYANPEIPTERFKATVYILDTRLRADGLKVNLFKEVYTEGLGWVAAEADPDTAIQIENAILTSARQLRIQTLQR